MLRRTENLKTVKFSYSHNYSYTTPKPKIQNSGVRDNIRNWSGTVNWSEVASSSVGFLLGVAEVATGIVGEIPSAGISTALVIDGGIRVGSNMIKLILLLTGESRTGVATPSNAGGWIGKGIDMATGSSYNDISYGQGVGSFTNDFVTFAISGGTALQINSTLAYPSVMSTYSYGLILFGTPYTAVSDGRNFYNLKP